MLARGPAQGFLLPPGSAAVGSVVPSVPAFRLLPAVVLERVGVLEKRWALAWWL